MEEVGIKFGNVETHISKTVDRHCEDFTNEGKSWNQCPRSDAIFPIYRVSQKIAFSTNHYHL